MANIPLGLPSGAEAAGTTLTKDQASEPPVGFADVITSALLSTAAQAVVVGHETPFTGRPVPAVVALQALLSGFVEVTIWPGLAVTQSEGDGQETLFKWA
jgi:hypothetical protein